MYQGKKNVPVVIRFESLLVNNGLTECWDWRGTKDEKGYGVFWVKTRNEAAHRFSFRYFKGDIPEGMFVCHRCDSPSCANPGHLFLGTAKDNTQDMMKKNRGRGHFKAGADERRNNGFGPNRKFNRWLNESFGSPN